MNLNQITAPSQDLTISIEFYQRLGLRLIVKALPKYARFECPDGDATFSLHQLGTQPVGNGVVIYFEDEALDSTVDRLVKAGIKFEELPTAKQWLWREARLKDPDGNQLILYQAGKNRKNPHWRIS